MDKISISPEWVFSPQPMYIIGTKNEDGTPNFCIITWLGFSFDNCPHLMMTVGGSKLTKTNIIREKKFSANLITEDNLWLAMRHIIISQSEISLAKWAIGSKSYQQETSDFLFALHFV